LVTSKNIFNFIGTNKKKRKKMKINFTKKEYVALLDLLEIALWVMDTQTLKIPQEKKPYERLVQKIYSFAKEMGCEVLIEHDADMQAYFPTNEFDETSPMMEYIDDYNNDMFWDELINKLVNRDLMNQFGSKRVAEMDIEEFFNKQDPIEDKYSTEFETNGVKNLYIKDANPKGVNVYRIK